MEQFRFILNNKIDNYLMNNTKYGIHRQVKIIHKIKRTGTN